MTPVELNRLRWNCRRGLLENDIVLERFLEHHLDVLDGRRLQAFNWLLAMDDNSLWDILSGREDLAVDTDPAITEVVTLLRNC